MHSVGKKLDLAPAKHAVIVAFLEELVAASDNSAVEPARIQHKPGDRKHREEAEIEQVKAVAQEVRGQNQQRRHWKENPSDVAHTAIDRRRTVMIPLERIPVVEVKIVCEFHCGVSVLAD